MKVKQSIWERAGEEIVYQSDGTVMNPAFRELKRTIKQMQKCCGNKNFKPKWTNIWSERVDMGGKLRRK